MFQFIPLLMAGMAAAAPYFNSSGMSPIPNLNAGTINSQYHPDPQKIMSVPQSQVTSYHTGGLRRANIYPDWTSNSTSRLSAQTTPDGWICSDYPTPIYTTGDPDTGGRGITINNAGTAWRGFYIYHNTCDDIPWKYTWIAPGNTVFISFPYMWEGRVERGIDSEMLQGAPQLLATWLELSWDVNDVGWADVSLIRGTDGDCLVWDPSNGNTWKGFTDPNPSTGQSVLDGCPGGCYAEKPDGEWVLMNTENVDGSINTAVDSWVLSYPGPVQTYVDDHHANPVVSAPGSRWASYWSDGRP